MNGTIVCSGDFNAVLKGSPVQSPATGADNEAVEVVSFTIPNQNVLLSLSISTTGGFEQGTDTPTPRLDMKSFSVSGKSYTLSFQGAYPEQGRNAVSLAQTDLNTLKAQCLFLFSQPLN